MVGNCRVLVAEMEVKDPSISTMVVHFENKFDPYNATSTPLYQTATFKQVIRHLSSEVMFLSVGLYYNIGSSHII